MNDRVYITPRYYVFASDEDGTSFDNSLVSSSDEDSNFKDRSSLETSSSFDQDLLDQVSLTNHLLVGIILFLGVFFGAFCMSHLYNRIRRD